MTEHHINVIAIVGACVPERRAYASRVAERDRAMLLSAARLAVAIDPIREAIALAPWAGSGGSVVVELPADIRATEIIGAFSSEPDDLRLTRVVCVVDASHLLTDLMRDDYVRARGSALHVARSELLVTQVEFASHIVLVNWEALSTPDLSTLMALANHLAPRARLSLQQGGDSLDGRAASIAGGATHALESGQDGAGWIALLNSEFDPHMTDPRVSGFRYTHERPLHPGRLQRVLDQRIEPGEFGTVARSAGFCRLATRPATVASWDHVGRVISFEPLGSGVSIDAELLAIGQDLAFIGIDLDRDGLGSALDEAALTDAEFEAGPDAWLALPDPFPEWATADDAHE
ncbi:GTP-binding protein [Leucobacter japonicus]|uniref:GTP-binding protein n=1 Tax=Leucobacter japonicus TaxID=1461259 RepID=UPI000A539F9F|nr:GTP-binding protein [Leucobacter japonicus]